MDLVRTPAAGDGWPVPAPPAGAQLWIWTRIGIQSFGGGQATQLLVYDAFVRQRRWMSAREYSETWALCQVPPGINLLALATILGWRQDRALGVLWALFGLLLPSSVLTVLFTIAYALISGSHWTAPGLRGVVGGVVGMGLVMTIRVGAPPLRASAQAGRLSLTVSLLVVAAAATIYVLFRPPVAAMFLGAGISLALIRWALRRRPARG